MKNLKILQSIIDDLKYMRNNGFDIEHIKSMMDDLDRCEEYYEFAIETIEDYASLMCKVYASYVTYVKHLDYALEINGESGITHTDRDKLYSEHSDRKKLEIKLRDIDDILTRISYELEYIDSANSSLVLYGEYYENMKIDWRA